MSKIKNLTKIKTILYSIIALIIGMVGGFSSYCLANSPQSDTLTKIASGDLSFHFLELGNKYAGDSIFIKANDIDILIDAGSRDSSAPSIISYVNNYCTDGILEYVIATHAHQDHIAAMPQILDEYEVSTLIDFGSANTFDRSGVKQTALYQTYLSSREEEISNGNTTYIAVSDYNNDNFKNIFDLGSGISFTIMYNYYYDHEETKKNQNNYSVCVLFSNGLDNILLTGDLEEEGEEKLVEYSKDAKYPSLVECSLFKAGHHGSLTASNSCLLEEIQPKNVVFTCVAGTSEYSKTPEKQFPSQDVINRISKYTKNCYVTSLGDNSKTSGYSSMNGNIIFVFGKNPKIVCSNNDTLLKDTSWFKTNRTTPSNW